MIPGGLAASQTSFFIPMSVYSLSLLVLSFPFFPSLSFSFPFLFLIYPVYSIYLINSIYPILFSNYLFLLLFSMLSSFRYSNTIRYQQ